MPNNLVLAGKKGGVAHKHQWTEEERAIVRAEYQGTKRSAQEIANRLGQGITANGVHGQCAKMGILKPKSPYWKESEVKKLIKLIPKYSVTEVAKRLHRSINAVNLKVKRLGLYWRDHEDWYTKKEVMEICGVDHKKVQTWIDLGVLKARWHNPEREPQQNGMGMWHIDREDLRAFIRRYPQELLGRNVDLIQIVDILVGLDNINPEQMD